MTKEEMSAMHERVMARIKKNGFPVRPLTEAERQRLADLRAFHEDTTRRFPITMKHLGDAE